MLKNSGKLGIWGKISLLITLGQLLLTIYHLFNKKSEIHTK